MYANKFNMACTCDVDIHVVDNNIFYYLILILKIYSFSSLVGLYMFHFNIKINIYLVV